MTASGVVRAGKVVVHTAALVFTAFWLVATSSVDGPAEDCFTGVPQQASLAVVLGSPLPPDNAAVRGCAGLDGLAPGATVVFDVTQGERPPESRGCYAWDLDALTGIAGVDLSSDLAPFPGALTAARGSFALPTDAGCRGTWQLQFAPDSRPASGELVSPLDAGPTQRWLVERWMTIAQAQFCGSVFAGTGTVSCHDRFVVESVSLQGTP